MRDCQHRSMEIFFEFCTKYKVVDIVQIYKDYDYNLLRRIPIRKMKKLTDRVLKEQKDRMNQQTYISFSDFVAMSQKDERPEEEILKELAEMEEEAKKEDPDGAIQTLRKHSDQERGSE